MSKYGVYIRQGKIGKKNYVVIGCTNNYEESEKKFADDEIKTEYTHKSDRRYNQKNSTERRNLMISYLNNMRMLSKTKELIQYEQDTIEKNRQVAIQGNNIGWFEIKCGDTNNIIANVWNCK